MGFRFYLTNVLLLSMAVAFLVHFALIAMWGQVIIQEPDRVILIAEINLFVVIIAFSICNLVRTLKN